MSKPIKTIITCGIETEFDQAVTAFRDMPSAENFSRLEKMIWVFQFYRQLHGERERQVLQDL